MRRGFIRKFEPVRILTHAQVEYLHSSTLEVLENTGIRFDSPKAVHILESAGCDVDHERGIVRFPSYLIEDSIRKAPSSFSVKARVPQEDLRLGGNRLYFMPAAGAKKHNEKTGDLSQPSLQENDQGVLICDALENVDFMVSYSPYFEIKDLEPVMLLAQSQASICQYSTRVSRGAQATDSFIWEAKLANAVNKQLIGAIEGASPLCFPKDAIQAAFEYMDHGFPLWVTGGSVMGGTSPVTVAGATVSNNAEILGMMTLAQVYKPGHPILANDFVIPMDMNSGNLFFGALGAGLHQMAFNQIYRDAYKIPVSNAMAAFPNAKIIDYQNGVEKTHLALSAALSGANMIAFIGSVSQELAWSPLQAVIDNDTVGLIGRYIEGFEVNEDTLALDVIKTVGHSGHSFLSQSHTREHWQNEYYIPRTFERSSFQQWFQSGRKTILDRARDRVEEILAQHKPHPLTAVQEKEIGQILTKARTYYRKKGLL